MPLEILSEKPLCHRRAITGALAPRALGALRASSEGVSFLVVQRVICCFGEPRRRQHRPRDFDNASRRHWSRQPIDAAFETERRDARMTSILDLQAVIASVMQHFGES